MAKKPRSVKLARALEREILSLQGTYVGENLSEIITFMLKEWLKTNRAFVTDLKRERRGRRKQKPSM